MELQLQLSKRGYQQTQQHSGGVVVYIPGTDALIDGVVRQEGKTHPVVMVCVKDSKTSLHHHVSSAVTRSYTRQQCPDAAAIFHLIIMALCSNGQAIMFYSCDLVFIHYYFLRSNLQGRRSSPVGPLPRCQNVL